MKKDHIWFKLIHQELFTTGKPQQLERMLKTQKSFYKKDINQKCKLKMLFTLPLWPWKKDSKVIFVNNPGQMDSTNIEVGVIREDKKFQVLTAAQIKEYLDELQWRSWCV